MVGAAPIWFLQIACTTLAYATIYRLLIADVLRQAPVTTALSVLFVPQLFRHLGFSALSPELVEPPEFAAATGMAFTVGDAVLMILAYASLIALHRRSRAARPLCWLFVMAGVGHDVSVSYTLRSAPAGILDQFGGHFYAATFFIPSLVVTHFLIFVQLLKRGRELP